MESSLFSGTKAARHAKSQNALSPEEWMQLPDILANPDAVYLQKKDSNLLFIRKLKNDKVIKVIIHPNFKEKEVFSQSVKTAFKVDLKDIEDKLKEGVLKSIR